LEGRWQLVASALGILHLRPQPHSCTWSWELSNYDLKEHKVQIVVTQHCDILLKSYTAKGLGDGYHSDDQKKLQ
jgi:hypothetical protein